MIACFLVCNTWFKHIKAGNFAFWMGLTYHNASKSFPIYYDTLKVYMVQVVQGVLSTNPKPQIITCKLNETNSIPSNTTPSHEMHIKFNHISKLYNNYTGRFPVLSLSGNLFIMISYHSDSNASIAATFKSCADKHRLLTYGAIMQLLKDRNMLLDLQILDNRASTEYKRIIKDYWGGGIPIGTTPYP